MINQYEVAACIIDEIPEIREELLKSSSTTNLFRSIQCLSEFTKTKIKAHDLKKVKQCFAVAEKIYFKGNTLVKIAIENIYVFAFSSMMYACSKEERNKLLGIMPMDLHTAYVQQLYK